MQIKTYNALALAGLICTSFYLADCSKQPAPAAKPVPVATVPVAPPKAPEPPPTVTVYNGLISADMGPIITALIKQGDKVRVLWHDGQKSDNICPDYIAGHSMGGNAAIRQANKCQAAGHPPKAIVVIDAGRAPLTYQIPANAKYECVSYYNSAHPIGGQEIFPDGKLGKLGACHNTLVTGYDHVYMPSAPGIIKGTLLTIPGAQE